MKIVVDNDCQISKVDEVYFPIIPEAIAAYLDVISAANIKDIRLMGSVPRGEARLVHSDIDFVAICTRTFSEDELIQLSESARSLSAQFAQVRKVDLEIECIGNICKAREFIFQTDSISVYGESLFSGNPIEIESTEIAKTNTPDIDYLIATYQEGVRYSKSLEETIQFSRWIGKDILKSMRRKLLVEKSIYAKSPREIHRQLVLNFSKHTVLFDNLLSAYLDPISDGKTLNALLSEVEKVKKDFKAI